MNQIQLLGTITQDPELRYTQSGTAVLKLNVAYNDRWTGQDGSKQEKAHFFTVTYFGKSGEIVNQYFSKGDRILISGSLQYETWTAQDGSKRSSVTIKGTGFDFIEKRPQGQPQQQQQGGLNQPQQQQSQTYQQQTVPGRQPQQQYNPPRQQQQIEIPQDDIDMQEIPF